MATPAAATAFPGRILDRKCRRALVGRACFSRASMVVVMMVMMVVVATPAEVEHPNHQESDYQG